MASVRDILKGGKPPRSENAQDGPELDVVTQGVEQGQHQTDEMTARLREVADQRVALMKAEIKRLTELIKTLEQSTDQPGQNQQERIEAAKKQLTSAEAALVRANESKQNTELTSSLRQENREPSLQAEQSLHQGQGPQKVGAALGMTGVPQPKQGVQGPKLKH